jgi:CheY-like chemotaxis protein
MTAAADVARWCAKVGADACLEKPFDIDKLLRVIAQVRSVL